MTVQPPCLHVWIEKDQVWSLVTKVEELNPLPCVLKVLWGQLECVSHSLGEKKRLWVHRHITIQGGHVVWVSQIKTLAPSAQLVLISKLWLLSKSLYLLATHYLVLENTIPTSQQVWWMLYLAKNFGFQLPQTGAMKLLHKNRGFR